MKRLIFWLFGCRWKNKDLTPQNTTIDKLIEEIENHTLVFCMRCKRYAQ